MYPSYIIMGISYFSKHKRNLYLHRIFSNEIKLKKYKHFEPNFHKQLIISFFFLVFSDHFNMISKIILKK